MQDARLPGRALGALVIASISTSILAADGEYPDKPGRVALDEVTIIGHRRKPADIPGSAHVVGQEELQKFLQSDVMRVLRSVPGVYVQEEEGFGLRPNIGIRGSGLDRSARVALLEDGVLIAPAPYSAPSAYYFPTQRRMYAIEVLKGPSSIAVGPRTTGGAINLVSTPIPDQFAANADLRVGQHHTLDAHLNIGNRGARFSWLVETVQAQNDGFKAIDGPAGVNMGPTGYEIEDYLVKLQFDSDPASALYQSLRIKAGKTDQLSHETYLGLTEDDFWQQPNRRYAASAGDLFTGKHDQLQASYVVDSDNHWRGEITAYRNNYARNWFKLRSVAGASIGSILDSPDTYAEEFSYLTGTTSPDGALVKRHNNRQYVSRGVQAKLTWDLQAGNTDIALTTGIRVHSDEEDRLQKQDSFRMQDSLLVSTSVGEPGSTTNRISSADAVSFFVDTDIRRGHWIFTPGARVENIDMRRLDFATDDPTRMQGPVRIRENSVSVLIPGLGALYVFNDHWRILGGIHKGFNPPAPGSEASEERSTNFEFGARFDQGRVNMEAIYFLNDYDNLVGTVTASTGGSGPIGDQFDGGDVIVQGLELSGNFALAGLIGDYEVPVSMQYTWTAEAEFRNAFDSGFDPWGNVATGDELPYIPQHQLRVAAGIEGAAWGLNLSANYVGRMRTTAGQGPFVPEDTINSHVVWDVSASWRFSDSVSSYIKIDNLFDEIYIAARRPAGLRPGLERTAYIGLTLTL